MPAPSDDFAAFQLAMVTALLPRLRGARRRVLRDVLRQYQAILAQHQATNPGEPLTQPLISDYILRALFAVASSAERRNIVP